MKNIYLISGTICYLIFLFQNKSFIQPKVKELLKDFPESEVITFMLLSPLIPYTNTIQAIVLMLAIILNNINKFLDYLLKILKEKNERTS